MPITAANAATDRAFLDDIKAHSLDDSLKAIYADWLDQQGEPDLAYAFRWAAKHKRHPSISPKKGYARWGAALWRQRVETLAPYQLPRPVYEALRPTTKAGNSGRSRNLRLAFQRLAMALKTLRDAIAC